MAVVVGCCAVALAAGAAATAGVADAAFTDTGTRSADLAADVLDPPTGLSATRSCHQPAPALRSVSQSTGTGTTITVDRPVGVLAGDALIAIVVHHDAPDVPQVAVADGWSDVVVAAGTASGEETVAMKLASSTEPATYTFSGLTDGEGTAVVVLAYSGVDPTQPIDSGFDIAYAGRTTVMGHAPITTTVADTRLVTAFFADDYSSTISEQWGTVTRADVVGAGLHPVALRVTDRVVAAAGSTGWMTAEVAPASYGRVLAVALRPVQQPTPVVLTWTETPDLYAAGYEGFRSDFPGYVVFGPGRTVTSYVDSSLGTTGADYSLRSYAGSWRSAWVTTSVATC